MKCLWENLKNKPTDTSIYKEIVIIIYQKLTGKVNKGRRNLARGQRGSGEEQLECHLSGLSKNDLCKSEHRYLLPEYIESESESLLQNKWTFLLYFHLLCKK